MEEVDLCNIKLCWGNSSFDYICGPSVGNSGCILGVWDPSMFEKHTTTISDYFITIRGKWIPNAKSLLIISVYAPQDLSEKKMLWDYLQFTIENWAGEVIIMGDFNEVRTQEKCFGSIFNSNGAAIFNHFISSSDLVEVPMGGCTFTWVHKSASKMSFDTFVEKISSKENLMRQNSKCKSSLVDIDKIIDLGKATSDILNERMNVMNSLHDMEKIKSTELA
ncbi:RNA-directed DNA polymerase, eukaryota [Tanacetum coccineum]